MNCYFYKTKIFLDNLMIFAESESQAQEVLKKQLDDVSNFKYYTLESVYKVLPEPGECCGD
jgi:hypothetical protein